MGKWNKGTIATTCQNLDKLRIPISGTERSSIQGDIPYYGANGQVGYIDDFIFDEPLILIAEDGGNFEQYETRPIAYRINGKSWVNNHAHILRALPAYDQDYIFYSLEHKNVLYYIAGGTRSKLTQKELSKIEIVYPEDIKEQRKIAQILTTLDEAISKTKAIIEKYKAIKEGLMQDLLANGIDENGVIRSPKTHKYKDSPLGKIPVEWEAKRIKNVMPLQRGFDLPNEKIKEGQYPVACSNGIVGYHNHFTTQGPCVWTGRSGTIGNVFFSLQNTWVHNTSLWVTNFNKNNPKFIYYLLTHFNLKKYAAGTGVPTLNRNDLHSEFVKVPSDIAEQSKIVERLESIDSLLEHEQKILLKLKRKKTGLMQDLLTHKVSVYRLLERSVENE